MNKYLAGLWLADELCDTQPTDVTIEQAEGWSEYNLFEWLEGWDYRWDGEDWRWVGDDREHSDCDLGDAGDSFVEGVT